MAIAASFGNTRPSLLLDFANSKTVDSRVTFTRSTTAKYYDGVTTAKAEENLRLQSQTFDTSWVTNDATVTADQTTAPDGTTTADLLAETATTASHSISQSSTYSLGLYTASVFVKKGPGATAPDILQVTLPSARFGSVQYANYNISSGTVGTTAGGVTASIQNVGGGWYRLIYTANCTSAGTSDTATIVFTNNNDGLGRGPSYLGATTSDVYIWGAQLEQRSDVTAYTPTTTQPITNYIPVLQTAAAGVPRIDHNPVTGECLGLLIEEQRTNLVTYSEQFDNAAWIKNNSTITSNTVVAPDGTLTGEKLVEDGTNNGHNVQSSNVTTTSGTTYTFTIYAKKAERAWLRLNGNTTGLVGAAFYNLQAGVLGTVAAGTTASITSVGNDWYRCVFTRAETVNSTLNFSVAVTNADNTTSYQGDGYSGIYIWGAQLEAGAFPTSYIPTVASQETRNGDAASMTGTNFSSWYRADEGSFYLEGVGQATARAIAGIGQGTFQTTMAFNAVNLIRVSGASPNVTLGTSIGGTVKLAAAIKPGNFAASANGAAAIADSTYQTLQFAANRFEIGQATGFNVYNGTIRKVAYYPQRLSNTNLQALTA